ncbi:phosphoribulokinase [Endozoicomonas sp. G2_1]|uniref:phosphoribulokinase n=1 Tax=Endozoicomonas sp. G2_1 TaxID=2821091 RepID=UPI001ADB8C93|nr:phosphoribulokinase [Endozoicomonas sp. G2_1]MBO9490996.1 phosphoribulokinase [Endozoicomonas sp. G2_1]
MSARHPIIAVTGSSGAGTSTTTESFEHIFRTLGISSAKVEGDSFHRYSRQEMDVEKRKAREEGRNLSYFGDQANDFDSLENLFKDYSESGKGKMRRYLHTFDEAVPYNQMPGTFTPWEDLGEGTDVLFYEGLHGGVVTETNNVAEHVDLLIGMVPIVNLEWIQKIIRDTNQRGHSREAVTASIVRSMEDYISFITPQFSRTHVNFQRVPTVDTSNPFSAKAIPTLDESFVVIRFRESTQVDFPFYLSMIDGAFMSRVNTMVVPGGKMGLAMELILTPLIKDLMDKKREANKQLDWMSDL